MENSRIELKGIVLQVRSNKIKVTLIIIYPSTRHICHFFLFHIEIEGKCGWIIGGGGGGGQRVCWPPLSNYWGAWPPLPPPLLFLRLCKILLQTKSANTIELQWLEHLWIHENRFETELMGFNHSDRSGGIIRINFRFF